MFSFSAPNNSSLLLPACVIGDAGVSKTYQIQYREEDLLINDAFMYRVHTLVDSAQVGSDDDCRYFHVSDLI